MSPWAIRCVSKQAPFYWHRRRVQEPSSFGQLDANICGKKHTVCFTPRTHALRTGGVGGSEPTSSHEVGALIMMVKMKVVMMRMVMMAMAVMVIRMVTVMVMAIVAALVMVGKMVVLCVYSHTPRTADYCKADAHFDEQAKFAICRFGVGRRLALARTRQASPCRRQAQPDLSLRPRAQGRPQQK
jgi:hypothetical protein